MARLMKVTDDALVQKNSELTFERTLLAYERTLIALLRTAASMISFGFTLYKLFEEMNETEKAGQRILTPRIAGMVMIGYGIMTLLLAQVNYVKAVQRLKEYYPRARFSFSFVLALLILSFGLVLFCGALLRQ
jgi:putative membrane protein